MSSSDRWTGKHTHTHLSLSISLPASSFEMTVLLIKPHLFPIAALRTPSHLRSLALTRPHPILVAPSLGPVSKVTSISFLMCQFVLLSSRSPAVPFLSPFLGFVSVCLSLWHKQTLCTLSLLYLFLFSLSITLFTWSCPHIFAPAFTQRKLHTGEKPLL